MPANALWPIVWTELPRVRLFSLLALKTLVEIVVTESGIVTLARELKLNALSPRVTSDVGRVMLVSKLDWKVAHPIEASLGELPKVTDVSLLPMNAKSTMLVTEFGIDTLVSLLLSKPAS